MPTNLPEIAFDEAGNTGADLLNDDQPIFALASVLLSNRQAEELLARIRTRQTKEIKFKNLKRSAAGRRRIITLISAPELEQANAKTTIYHKRFMVTAKIVDILIETVLHDLGFDLYRDGANIALANLHYMCMPAFCGKERSEEFLRLFVAMIRTRDVLAVNRFYQAASSLYSTGDHRECAELLEPIIASRPLVPQILAANDRNSLDPSIPAVVHHCISWGEAIGGPFRLLHDESKSVFEERADLEDLMSRGEQEEEVGYDRRKYVLPLRAREIKFEKSNADARIQVADLIASASAYWVAGCASPARRTDFWTDLDAADVGRFAIDAVWPTSHISPAELDTEYNGGTNAVEEMAALLRKRRK